MSSHEEISERSAEEEVERKRGALWRLQPAAIVTMNSVQGIGDVQREGRGYRYR